MPFLLRKSVALAAAVALLAGTGTFAARPSSPFVTYDVAPSAGSFDADDTHFEKISDFELLYSVIEAENAKGEEEASRTDAGGGGGGGRRGWWGGPATHAAASKSPRPEMTGVTRAPRRNNMHDETHTLPLAAPSKPARAKQTRISSLIVVRGRRTDVIYLIEYTHVMNVITQAKLAPSPPLWPLT